MNLTIIKQDGQLLVDSREVAEMVSKQHAHLLRDIKGYAETLTKSNFGVSEFFIETTYQDITKRNLLRYLITKKGCDLVANKMIGEKGILFTATYVTKFDEMEQQLNKPKSQLEILQASIGQLVEQERRISEVELRIVETEKKQDNINEILSLNPTEWRKKVAHLLNGIATNQGGHDAFRSIRTESYERLEERAKCKLSIRLTNKRQKMSFEGVPKSKIDKVNNMDVISDDARLTEIYLAVVKEMAIKYGAENQGA